MDWTSFSSITLPIIMTFALRELSAWRRDIRKSRLAGGELEVLLREYRLHAHVERYGPLTAEGIRYPHERQGD